MPPKKKVPEKTVHEQLAERLAATEVEVEREKLPGWEGLLERNSQAKKTVTDRRMRLEMAVRDEDKILFDRSLHAWRAACDRVNEVLAEEYRAANPDPEAWQLRYLKWMKVKYIRFASPLGEFFVVPRAPQRQPKNILWYTADEMIAMLHPTTAAAINTFAKLPARPESLGGPAAGERHMHVDFTGDEVVIKYDLPKGPRYGREGVR